MIPPKNLRGNLKTLKHLKNNVSLQNIELKQQKTQLLDPEAINFEFADDKNSIEDIQSKIVEEDSKHRNTALLMNPAS